MGAFARLSEWGIRVSSGRVALLGLVVFVLFTAVVLPRQSASAGEYSETAGSPDMSFLYSPDDLYDMAEAYGVEGRSAYITARSTFDVAWPVVYVLFLGTAISWSFGRALAEPSPWRRANLFPVAGLLFDYCENVATSVVMWRYPEPSPLAALLAPAFTPAKWFFVGGSFVVLATGLVLVARRRAAERKEGGAS